ncbi:thiamine pyrophosphokinase [Trichophyton interdigitale H6]|nr:thiamine pyrophosphokinase [Trichophyton interdigitale H6]
MEWHPARLFEDSLPPVPFALLILNQPVNHNALRLLKRHACFIICADGGANRYYHVMKRLGLEKTELPNAIVGDLDSIYPDVRKHYQSLRVPIIENPDQYSTDFMKCLSYLADNCSDIINTACQYGDNGSSSCPNSSSKALDVVIFGGLGGRVDQGFAQIHHLFCTTTSASEQVRRPKGELYLISEESVSFFLRPGNNVIQTFGGSCFGKDKEGSSGLSGRQTNNTDQQAYFSENIGIIPIGGPSIISTQGFEWDVSDWKTEFGGNLSTSNHIRADLVKVETSAPVLFTVELAPNLKLAARKHQAHSEEIAEFLVRLHLADWTADCLYPTKEVFELQENVKAFIYRYPQPIPGGRKDKVLSNAYPEIRHASFKCLKELSIFGIPYVQTLNDISKVLVAVRGTLRVLKLGLIKGKGDYLMPLPRMYKTSSAHPQDLLLKATRGLSKISKADGLVRLHTLEILFCNHLVIEEWAQAFDFTALKSFSLIHSPNYRVRYHSPWTYFQSRRVTLKRLKTNIYVTEAMNYLRSLDSLEELYFTASPVYPNFGNFFHFSNLRVFLGVAFGTGFFIRNLQMLISGCPRLEELGIPLPSVIQSAVWSVLAHAPALRCLYFVEYKSGRAVGSLPLPAMFIFEFFSLLRNMPFSPHLPTGDA